MRLACWCSRGTFWSNYPLLCPSDPGEKPTCKYQFDLLQSAIRKKLYCCHLEVLHQEHNLSINTVLHLCVDMTRSSTIVIFMTKFTGNENIRLLQVSKSWYQDISSFWVMGQSASTPLHQRDDREGGNTGGAVWGGLLPSYSPSISWTAARSIQVQDWQLTQVNSFQVDSLGVGDPLQVDPFQVDHVCIGQGDWYPHRGLLVFCHWVNHLHKQRS